MFLALEDILSQSKYSLTLPSKKSEKWHFSGLYNYLERDYHLIHDNVGDGFEPKKDGFWAYFKDGQYIKGNLPDGVMIQAQKEHEVVENNPFSLMASTTSASAITFVFSADSVIDIYVDYSSQSFVTSSFDFIVKDGVDVSIDIVFNGGSEGFITHSSYSELYPRSHLNITQTQSLDTGAAIISQNSFLLHEHALCKSFVLLYSGAFLQHFTEAKLAFESEINVSSLLLGHAAEKQMFSCDIQHQADKSKSRVISKQVLKDSSIGVFDATTLIEKNTKATQAYQASHALLLGEKAQIHSKPHLEIYSDDLTASHGSTVGELDIESIGYLCSRGINESQAKEMLVAAFIHEMLDLVDEHAFERLSTLLGGDHA